MKKTLTAIAMAAFVATPAFGHGDHTDVIYHFPERSDMNRHMGLNKDNGGDGWIGLEYFEDAWEDDQVRLGTGNDVHEGDDFTDIVRGNTGDDTIKGYSGHDLLMGGRGDDELRGGADNDVLMGGKGDDAIYGHHGYDVLHGGPGDDDIWGGSGHNLVIGGPGTDNIYVHDQRTSWEAETPDGFNYTTIILDGPHDPDVLWDWPAGEVAWFSPNRIGTFAQLRDWIDPDPGTTNGRKLVTYKELYKLEKVWRDVPEITLDAMGMKLTKEHFRPYVWQFQLSPTDGMSYNVLFLMLKSSADSCP